MQTQGTTIDPRSGKTYRLTAPKERTPEFRALEANVEIAKNNQGCFMKEHHLFYDVASKTTKTADGAVLTEENPLFKKLKELLDATRASQQAVKAYKKAHPSEFQQTTVSARSPIPTINVPRGRGRKGGRGGYGRPFPLEEV